MRHPRPHDHPYSAARSADGACPEVWARLSIACTSAASMGAQLLGWVSYRIGKWLSSESPNYTIHSIRTDSSSRFRLLHRPVEIVQIRHPHDRGWFRLHVTGQSWGKTERELRAYIAGLRTNTLLLCASAPTEMLHPKDDLYMWGHYRRGHRGLAIEFDSAALSSAVLGHHSIQGGALLQGE